MDTMDTIFGMSDSNRGVQNIEKVRQIDTIPLITLDAGCLEKTWSLSSVTWSRLKKTLEPAVSWKSPTKAWPPIVTSGREEEMSMNENWDGARRERSSCRIPETET